MSAEAPRVWFITGSSKGLGWHFADAALKAGDRVVATARDPSALHSLVDQHGDQVFPFPLDVTDRSAIRAAVDAAIERFGHLDIVVNNAGYVLFGAIEEVTDAQIRRQMDTNFFGALDVTRAVIPHLRAQRSGHIVQISSVAGAIAVGRRALYTASKWALEGLSEALALELEPFNVKVTIVEPGSFETHVDNAGTDLAEGLPAYCEAFGPLERGLPLGHPERQRHVGDPSKAAAALLTIVGRQDPPLRVAFGNKAYDRVTRTLASRLDAIAKWEALSRSTDYDD